MSLTSPDVRRQSLISPGCQQKRDSVLSPELRRRDSRRSSVKDYLIEKGIPDRMMGLAVAGYSNTAGQTDLDKISYSAQCKMEKHWEETEDHLDERIDSRISMAGVIDVLKRDIGDDTSILTNWKVRTIDYSGDKIKITSTTGEELEADKCVISVSAKIMQTNVIQFVPELSQKKIDAFNMVGLERAVKLLIKFKKNVWPEKLQSLICADCDIPEMWFREFEINENEKHWVAVCYCMSESADKIVQGTCEEATAVAIKQLQRIFDVSDEEIEQNLLDSMMFDWGAQENVGGGYTTCKVGIKPAHFNRMAEPVNDKLFFCGESTHKGAAMTVQAALETGIRAADEVCVSIETINQGFRFIKLQSLTA